MEVPDAMLEILGKALVSDMIQVRLQVFLLDVQEAFRVLVRATVGNDVIGGEAALFPRRDEDDDRFSR